VEAELIGMPAVVLTTTGFTVLARALAKSSGLTDLRVAEYPGPVAMDRPDVLAENVRTVLFDRVVAALTGARKTAPTARTRQATWDARKIVFEGSLDEVNDFFTRSGWTDGLPIIPPTEERVEAFLKQSTIAPSTRIAALSASNLVATPVNVAVNAIMAGCRPEHMPIVLAAVEALADERACLSNIGSSSGLIPYILVNGPIAKELGIASGKELISAPANRVLGRAVGLIIHNIAGFQPGKTYMGTFGYPLVFAVAEDEQQSPWEPFQVSQGFPADANTVTACITTNWGSAREVLSTEEDSVAISALKLLCREIAAKVRIFYFPNIGPKAEKVMLSVMLSASIAKCFADEGFSKKDIADYLYEHARMPLREFDWLTRHTYPSSVTVHAKALAGMLPPEYLGQPEDSVRLLSSPDIVHVMVCGDPDRNRMMLLEGGHTQPTTKAIRRVSAA